MSRARAVSAIAKYLGRAMTKKKVPSWHGYGSSGSRPAKAYERAVRRGALLQSRALHPTAKTRTRAGTSMPARMTNLNQRLSHSELGKILGMPAYNRTKNLMAKTSGMRRRRR